MKTESYVELRRKNSNQAIARIKTEFRKGRKTTGVTRYLTWFGEEFQFASGEIGTDENTLKDIFSAIDNVELEAKRRYIRKNYAEPVSFDETTQSGQVASADFEAFVDILALTGIFFPIQAKQIAAENIGMLQKVDERIKPVFDRMETDVLRALSYLESPDCYDVGERNAFLKNFRGRYTRLAVGDQVRDIARKIGKKGEESKQYEADSMKVLGSFFDEKIAYKPPRVVASYPKPDKAVKRNGHHTQVAEHMRKKYKIEVSPDQLPEDISTGRIDKNYRTAVQHGLEKQVVDNWSLLCMPHDEFERGYIRGNATKRQV